MAMTTMPDVKRVPGGTLWSNTYHLFTARVYTPENDLPGQVINLGFKAPCLTVLEEKPMSEEEIIAFAEKTGLKRLAASFDSSVIFIAPVSGDWEKENEELYKELIAETKIGPFYKDGVLIQKNFFRPVPDTYFIRGAIFRVCLFGKGKAADWAAKHLMKTVNGEYLWGPGVITPSALCLEGLSVIPAPERDDIAVISLGNSEKVNEALRSSCKYLLEKDQSADYEADWRGFTVRFKRWCGVIDEEPEFDTNGVIEEYGLEEITTSPENTGRYQGTETHPVGYFAYYNKGLLEKGPLPTVITFHGGGDSALHIAHVSGWWRVAAKYNFLSICVENHMDVTATEAVELVEKLKKKYPIDTTRLYATGFSMGGCKTWDLYQEYPGLFAALAPMDATFDVGLNMFGAKAPRLNRDTPVPVFYAGGEETPLPELPFQADKCTDRMAYVFEVNKIRTPYDVKFDAQEKWANRIWGVNGDSTEKIYDESRDAVLTLHRFKDTEGKEMLALASISPQGHECRQHTCEQAWLFMSRYHR